MRCAIRSTRRQEQFHSFRGYHIVGCTGRQDMNKIALTHFAGATHAKTPWIAGQGTHVCHAAAAALLVTCRKPGPALKAARTAATTAQRCSMLPTPPQTHTPTFLPHLTTPYPWLLEGSHGRGTTTTATTTAARCWDEQRVLRRPPNAPHSSALSGCCALHTPLANAACGWHPSLTSRAAAAACVWWGVAAASAA